MAQTIKFKDEEFFKRFCNLTMNFINEFRMLTDFDSLVQFFYNVGNILIDITKPKENKTAVYKKIIIECIKNFKKFDVEKYLNIKHRNKFTENLKIIKVNNLFFNPIKIINEKLLSQTIEDQDYEMFDETIKDNDNKTISDIMLQLDDNRTEAEIYLHCGEKRDLIKLRKIRRTIYIFSFINENQYKDFKEMILKTPYEYMDFITKKLKFSDNSYAILVYIHFNKRIYLISINSINHYCVNGINELENKKDFINNIGEIID